ncbi:MAG: exopolyphosphatase [Spirochaetaceae bacterium]|nr:MAG: exopolyphosphatase [Spirochaetaceae bacterium]
MAADRKKYRLVTRSDFDGLVCAVLLKERDMIDEIKFVHPKDMQDGLIAISDDDITANLPYVDGVHIAFDHHLSETRRNTEHEGYVIMPEAPSAARVIYEHYGGKKAFPNVPDDLIQAVDKGDSAAFSMDEVLHPQGWDLLNFIMDARTGLGRFRNFRVSNYQLMMDLIDYCREYTIEEILDIQDVRERVDLYRQHEQLFKEQSLKCSTVHDNVLVVDLRAEETIYAGNRFLKYALFPDTDISVQVIWGFKKQNTVLSVGKSIFRKTSTANVGELMLEYGGGGHMSAGTCQVANEDADRIITEIIGRLKGV